MLYAFISQDVETSLAGRDANRESHMARLQELAKAGRLVLAGPHPAIDTEHPGSHGFTGSLIVADFRSLEEARAWAEKDPYVINGVHSSLVVKPFKMVFP